MTDTPTTADKPANPAAPADGAAPADQAVEEWKPEPRQWTWKDLFTAPMLAFKPKCMLIMAVTALVIALWYKIQPGARVFGADTPSFIGPTLAFIWNTVALILFSLSASLVATFMKADLLDDEFLTFGEALGQWKGRILSAVLVPAFLMGIYGGFLALLAGCELVGSIPYAGTALYALLYPLGVLLSLFIFLLSIAVGLSVFVFPSIIAIRKHGWFDNVVDTFEAVGTKPHVLVGSAIITGILVIVSGWISFGAMGQLSSTVQYMPSKDLKATEARADSVSGDALGWFHPGFEAVSSLQGVMRQASASASRMSSEGTYFYASASNEVTGWPKITGTVTGIWKLLFTLIFTGYLANLMIGGGMLTYLAVREDDYWDDEDLEDLDKLAKELEEEAKAEAAKAGGDKPAEKPAEVPKAEVPKAEAPAADASPEATPPAADKPADPPKAD